MRDTFVRAAVVAAFSVLGFSARSKAATYQGHDLYSLQLLNDFSGAIPTGFHPASGGVVGGQLLHGDNFAHAAVWNSAGVPTDLNPTGYANSYIYAANASHQVGYATTGSNGTQGHAFLWSNTPASAVDLTPAGYFTATAYGLGTNQQVGSGATIAGGNDHAMTWLGNAGSFTDINPTGMTVSHAYDTDDVHQVGSGSGTTTGNAEHALRWTNGAGAVDLHPTNLAFGFSTALTVDGQLSGGYASVTPGSNRHAILWTSESPIGIDLTPSTFVEAIVYDVNNSIEVGSALTSGGFATHAALWSGSADSFVDLHALLPAGFGISIADSIGADGTIYGYAQDTNLLYHAVSWTPVPEPTMAATAGVMFILVTLRRRRR